MSLVSVGLFSLRFFQDSKKGMMMTADRLHEDAPTFGDHDRNDDPGGRILLLVI